jgi:vancomycin resistance protein YoaR
MTSNTGAATHPRMARARANITKASPISQAILALLIGFGLLALLVVSLPSIYSRMYAGRIFPGVTVGGLDLSGLSADQAATLIAKRLDYPQRGKIVFQEGTSLWTANPAALGLTLDTQTTALAAYNLGRTGSLTARMADQWRAWSSGVELAPWFVFDQRVAQSYLQGIAGQVDRPIIEATLGISGVDVVVNSGQVGRTLDVANALSSLDAQMKTMTDGLIPLVVKETPPVILDATAQAELARQILSAPLTLRIPNAEPGDPGPWSFEPAALVPMLTINRVKTDNGETYQVGLSPDMLRTFLMNVAPPLSREPQNARFIFNDDTRQLEVIQPAVIGRALDIDSSLAQINQQLLSGNHNVDLVMQTTNPQVTNDATAESLGITELTSAYTSYFYGSDAARIQNITTAASRFHGLLIAPGATFSMADALGDVSLDNGFAEALIIFGDRTIKGVGGGVCQVSTTLFRTVFFGGYQIDERWFHAYRVKYYEQTASGGHDENLAGLDATVFAPEVDFRFTNDSPYWLLMETYPTKTSLTWKFYSTSDGRTVDWQTSGLQNVVEPPQPLYEENTDLQKDEIKQVDWAVAGADVSVNRTVTRDGSVVHDDTFNTHYLPWQAKYQYGPGTEVPTPEPTPNP